MDLLKTLKKPEMRKIFGKRELVIIEKQLWGMKLKPSEKTRLSRDIRKKFEAVKELIQFANNFNLKHGVAIKEVVQEAKEAIVETEHFPRIKRIYLFGSAAEKTHIFKSDIDIAVEFDNISLKEATSFRIKTRVPERIDLQVYNVLPDKIKKEINEKGKIIYERQN